MKLGCARNECAVGPFEFYSRGRRFDPAQLHQQNQGLFWLADSIRQRECRKSCPNRQAVANAKNLLGADCSGWRYSGLSSGIDLAALWERLLAGVKRARRSGTDRSAVQSSVFFFLGSGFGHRVVSLRARQIVRRSLFPTPSQSHRTSSPCKFPRTTREAERSFPISVACSL